MSKTLVTAKVNPDMDGVASSYAYAELYGATPVFYGALLPEPHFVLRELKITPLMNLDKWEGNFVIVDASSMRGMPSVIDPCRVIEVIDHRFVAPQEVKELFPNARVQIELVGAAATLLAERFEEVGKEPSEKVASLIYCAIISNTLNLNTRNTTFRDKKILSKMRKLAPLSKKIAEEMLRYKTKYIEENLEEVIRNDFKWWEIKNEKIGIAQLEVYKADNILDRTEDIIRILKDLKSELSLDICFLNMPDIEDRVNYFLFPDPASREFLGKIVNFDLEGNLGKSDQLILRKEILKLINEMIRSNLF